jgi:cytochrome c biogenesis protein CcmG/thiol:disulfide interchange protein DsbE
MNRYATALVVFGLLVIVFAVTLCRAPDTKIMKSALIGKPAQVFTLPDLLEPGKTVSNEAFKGRWYLLNVWGTWCGECRHEHPVLLDIQREGKVAVLGLNYQDEDDKARQWLMDLGNPYEIVAIDREGRASIDYGVYGAPESFLVNPEGIIVHKVIGQITAGGAMQSNSWAAIKRQYIEGAAP